MTKETATRMSSIDWKLPLAMAAIGFCGVAVAIVAMVRMRKNDLLRCENRCYGDLDKASDAQ